MRKKIISIKTPKTSRTNLPSPSRPLNSLLNIIIPGRESLVVPKSSGFLRFPDSQNRIVLCGGDRFKTRIKGNLFVIGDIHGSLTKLEQLINNLNVSKNDIVLTLGDSIDRGENSKGVIEFLLGLQEQTTVINLGGNHDYLCMTNHYMWAINGALETLMSYGAHFEFRNYTYSRLKSKFGLSSREAIELLAQLKKIRLATDTRTNIATTGSLLRFYSFLRSIKEEYKFNLGNDVMLTDRSLPFNTHPSFFKSLRDYAWTEGNWKQHYHLSHAGGDPDDPTNINLLLGLSGDRSYMFKQHTDNFFRIFGHTPVTWRNRIAFPENLVDVEFKPFEPLRIGEKLDIDTAAYSEGPLTCVVITNGEMRFVFSN